MGKKEILNVKQHLTINKTKEGRFYLIVYGGCIRKDVLVMG